MDDGDPTVEPENDPSSDTETNSKSSVSSDVFASDDDVDASGDGNDGVVLKTISNQNCIRILIREKNEISKNSRSF